MTTSELQAEILRLKQEKNVFILAHSYQNKEITEIADCTGDSFYLSKVAKEIPNQKILVCGVKFMAETVKILSPQKNVFISNENALCPMAQQIDLKTLQELKKQNPEFTVVAYVNTTAELKTECDVCVTSSSALKIVQKIQNQNILFIPDCNLGGYIKQKIQNKNIKLINGNCPVHNQITVQEVLAAKENHPDALLLVHPECKTEISNMADFIGSTSEIMNFAKASNKKEFIIGTENSIINHLQCQNPNKNFFVLSKKCICSDMKLTNLFDIYNFLKNDTGKEIVLDAKTIQKAQVCINKMIELEAE